MTAKMKAIVATGTGGAEVLQMANLPLAWPKGRRDVLVRLKAASLNPADVYFRKFGGYKTEAPLVLGHDGAGIIEEIGAGVRGLKAGDRVAFCNGGIGGAELGTYAEFAIVPDFQLVKIPKKIDFIEAAALPLVAITLWEALYDRAKLKAGEHVLIHAGAGGTGHIGVQLAKLRGAKVAATVSSKAKADLVAKLGAERPILYRNEDFSEAARKWTGGKGLDVALNNVGDEIVQKTFTAMAPYGRVVSITGMPADDKDYTAYNANLAFHNVMMLTPMWVGLPRHLKRQAAIVEKSLALMAKGKLKVVIDKVFPLAKAGEAQAHLESGKAVGKIVLKI
jgi:NADPH2:quinone reductase